MLETAGLQLLVEIHRQQRPAFVDWLESRHPVSPLRIPFLRIMPAWGGWVLEGFYSVKI